VRQLHPIGLKEWLDDTARTPPLLLDVRESWEFRYCHIDGSQQMPLGQVAMRLVELDPEREIVMICHLGVRSYRAGLILKQAGFANVYNLQGGVEAWARDVDPNMPKY
jgi:rhodanese-related sulfurtransferase